jgi:hypothetical protein
MRVKFESEFKKALQTLPEQEKDKLILRLLKHDVLLANKLHFELIDTDTALDKRVQLEKRINDRIRIASENYHNSGHLLMDIRGIVSEITEHVAITKDKYGEISLNCLLLLEVLKLNNENIASETYGNVYKLSVYIITRIFKILMLIQKQHEDLHIDFKEDVVAIGKLIGRNPYMMKTAIYNNLDVNWLIQFRIPDNIADIYKSLRENGFLR